MGAKVQAEGLESAKIMIIGEAPGRQEEVAGRPFVGGAGEVLRNTLARLGVKESDVFYSNLSKHRPPGNELRAWFDKSGMPTDQRLIDGLRELKAEVAAVNPTVIVALGNYPLWFLTGKTRWSKKWGYTGIGDWRGSIIEGRPNIEGRKVVAAYHPAAILRKYSWLPFLQLDLQRVKEQSMFPEIRRPAKTLHIDVQGEERKVMFDRLMNHGDFITADVEMLGSNLLCMSFTSDKDESWGIRTKTGSDLKFCREIVESGKGLCFQNGMFDASMTEYWLRWDMMRHIKHDTMLMMHSAYIEQPKDLGTICSMYTEQPCYWTDVNWKEVKKAPDKHADQIGFQEYNCIDTWVTHDAAEQLLADELQDKPTRDTYDFEMTLFDPIWRIAKRGLKVDKVRMKMIHTACETAIAEGSKKLNEIAGHEINVRSNTQVPKFLFEELGLPVQGLTDAGKPAANDYVLADLDLMLKEDGPKKQAVQLLRKIRKSASIISKFTSIEYDKDGRMRCHYNIGGTNTGRLASKKFYPTDTGTNLQNIPAGRSEEDKEVRYVFVPDPGYEFFYNDLERAESLVVAKLTGDPTMLEHHMPGVNAHKKLAALLFNVIEEEVDNKGNQYYMAKQTRHAGNYMEGPKVFMKNINKAASKTGVSITLREANFFIGRYREIHPNLQKWWDDTAYVIKHTGILYNLCPHRRPRRFYDRPDSCLPAAVAYVPQSTIGDSMNIAIARIDKDEECKKLDVQMLLQVHDALGGQVPKPNVQSAMALMKQHMSIDLTVPKTGEVFQVPVEIATGPSWGGVKPW